MKLKTRILSGCLLAALSLGILSGCTIAKDVMDDESATKLTEGQVDVSVIGTWDIPGKDRPFEFKKDGTYVDHFSSGRTGTYSYMSQNASFTISDMFDKVEYIMCTADNGDNVLNGAILGDLISSYSQLDSKELYYLRVGRDEVPQEALLGSWRCVDRTAYQLTFNADGTANTKEDSGVYEIVQDPTYGTGIKVTITHDNKDETTEYAVYPYEKYLFLGEVGEYKMYQMEPFDPNEK